MRLQLLFITAILFGFVAAAPAPADFTPGTAGNGFTSFHASLRGPTEAAGNIDLTADDTAP
jgi:hypothetical protein